MPRRSAAAAVAQNVVQNYSRANVNLKGGLYDTAVEKELEIVKRSCDESNEKVEELLSEEVLMQNQWTRWQQDNRDCLAISIILFVLLIAVIIKFRLWEIF